VLLQPLPVIWQLIISKANTDGPITSAGRFGHWIGYLTCAASYGVELQPIDLAWRCHGMDNRTPIDEEAAEPDHRAKGKAKKKTKPSETSKGEDVLIAELDKGPLGA
jgi:hypothetical protein